MMTNLSWSALFLGVLGAVAWWNGEDRRDCDESRPPFGAMPCCERHRTAAAPSAAMVESRAAERRSARPAGRP